MPSTWKERNSPGDGVSIQAPRTRKISNENMNESTADRPGKIARHPIRDKLAFTNTGECEKFANLAKKASRFLRRIRRSSRRMVKNCWVLQSDNYFERSVSEDDREKEDERKMRKSSTLSEDENSWNDVNVIDDFRLFINDVTSRTCIFIN